MGIYTSCVSGSIGSAWVYRGPVRMLSRLSKGPCGFYRIAHAPRVELHRNWHVFLFQEIYACSYGDLHELSVRLYKIRMSLSRAGENMVQDAKEGVLI